MRIHGGRVATQIAEHVIADHDELSFQRLLESVPIGQLAEGFDDSVLTRQRFRLNRYSSR